MDKKDKGATDSGQPGPNSMRKTLGKVAVPAAIVVGGALVVGVAVPAAIAIAGFSTGGVVAGSIAAGIQAGIGNVAAGGAFAALQSAGTMPLITGAIGAAAGAGGGAMWAAKKHSPKVAEAPETEENTAGGAKQAAGSATKPTGIRNFSTGSAFAILQSAGTIPLITGAGGGSMGAAMKHAPKVSEAFGTAANAAGGAMQAAGSAMKTTGESAAQTFMNTAPLVKSAIGDATVATGNSMAIARDTAKAFTSAMPVVNGVFNHLAKDAGGAAVNVQENVSKTFEGTKPWVAGAVGNTMRATGGGAAVVGRKGEEVLKAVRKIPFRSVFRGRL